MIKILLYLILSFPMVDCKGQTGKNELGPEELLDPISPGTPFILKRTTPFLDLSAKLGKERVKGIVGLSVYIDSSGNLQGFKIIKLKVETEGESDVDFTSESNKEGSKQKSDYPEEVQKYYSSIEDYLNNLRFERDERIPLKTLNELTFIVRLK
jgi:hypothetical protein